MAAALGLGLAEGDVTFSLGTSGTVYSVSSWRPTRTPRGRWPGFADATGRFMPLVCTLNATKVSDTFAPLAGRRPGRSVGPGAGGRSPRHSGRSWCRTSTASARPTSPTPPVHHRAAHQTPAGRTGAGRGHDGVLAGLSAGLDALRAGRGARGRAGDCWWAAGLVRLRTANASPICWVASVLVPHEDRGRRRRCRVQAAVVVDSGVEAAPDAFAEVRGGRWGSGDRIPVVPTGGRERQLGSTSRALSANLYR